MTTVPEPSPEDLAEEADPTRFDPDMVWDDEPGADDLPDDPGPRETGVVPVVES